MKRLAALSALIALSLGAAAPAAAQSSGMQGMDMKTDKDHKGMAEHKSHKAAGTVKSVDTAKGTVTIDHEAINSINWPAMTMTFKAKNEAMLQAVRPGEKVDFSLVQSGSDYTVTQIKARK
jgi:Cu(I)/Ag(I) efflux system periplasmic protein CusF